MCFRDDVYEKTDIPPPPDPPARGGKIWLATELAVVCIKLHMYAYANGHIRKRLISLWATKKSPLAPLFKGE